MSERSSCQFYVTTILHYYDGEFDPGSGRTLAAWIRHASRTVSVPSGTGRVANGRVTRRLSTLEIGTTQGNLG